MVDCKNLRWLKQRPQLVITIRPVDRQHHQNARQDGTGQEDDFLPIFISYL
jgi:hypothetical protein